MCCFFQVEQKQALGERNTCFSTTYKKTKKVCLAVPRCTSDKSSVKINHGNRPGHLEVSVVHSRHCPYGKDATYELDSTQCGGPLLHHMHADSVQFSHEVWALHGVTVHSA